MAYDVERYPARNGENITFHLTDGTARIIPWPSQGGE